MPRRSLPGDGPRPLTADVLVERLYREHGSVMLGYARTLTGDRHVAEDLVQEALLRAWRHHEDLTEDRGSIRGWLLTVVRNLAHDRSRHLARRPPEVRIDVQAPESAAMPDRSMPDPGQAVVDAHVIAQAMARLSAEHRAVIHLLKFEGLSVHEAAERLGVPAGTVKSRTYYALRSLRLAYHEIGGTR